MLTLGIHTAGGSCSAAVLENETSLAEIDMPMKRGHDQHLPEIVQRTAEQAGVRLSDLDQISVCVGPGSFTGIRVGVAFARGLALANSGTAIGVSSLEALKVVPSDPPCLSLIPARLRPPDQSFWAQSPGQDILPDPVELSVEELRALITPQVSLISTQTGADMLAGHFPETAVAIQSQSARGVALWSIRADQSRLRAPSPLYVRDPDAIPAKPLA